jgi:hypothetical protein
MKGAFVPDNICGNFVKGRHAFIIWPKKKKYMVLLRSQSDNSNPFVLLCDFDTIIHHFPSKVM